MSHQPERKEKDCLNCGTIVQGRYCHVCGQENIVTRQNFWGLARHFIYDVFHFDGKFFDTVKYFFSRPGFIAREYTAGKRQKYLDPVRMYLFTSAVFFLVFFSIEGLKNINVPDKASTRPAERRAMAVKLQEKLKRKPGDSLLKARIALLLDTTKQVNVDSLEETSEVHLFSGDKKYASLHEYDSIQQALPENQKDGWFSRRLNRKSLQLAEKYKNGNEGVKAFLEIFLHKLPYMLFISLPFFALILKLLYIRRKNFYYSDHAVFTLYHYVFSFILLLLVFMVSYLHERLEWGFLSFLLTLLLLSWPAYLVIEMKKFYRQGWAKTLGKFLLLNTLGVVVLILLFIGFLFFSIFQM